MRKAIVVTSLLVLLLPASVVAQDEAASLTVVPNDQFCNLVSDDLAACEMALATLASGGLLPEAFAGLIVTAPEASDDSAGADGEPIVMEGVGIAATAPFDLPGGDYVAALDTGACDTYSAANMKPTDGSLSANYVTNEGSAESYFYGIDPGRYFWDVTALCDEWMLTLTPLAG